MNIYDALYRHKSFVTFTIDDFFEKQISWEVQYKKKSKIDINYNSDASLKKYKKTVEVKNNDNDNDNFIANSQDENEANMK